VGRIDGQVAEKALTAGRALTHPLHGLAEEDIRAIAFERFVYAVVFVNVVEVIIIPITCGGRNMGGRKPNGFFEAAILRAAGIVVAQVSFAE
jgi:hypothetical protein